MPRQAIVGLVVAAGAGLAAGGGDDEAARSTEEASWRADKVCGGLIDVSAENGRGGED